MLSPEDCPDCWSDAATTCPGCGDLFCEEHIGDHVTEDGNRCVGGEDAC